MRSDQISRNNHIVIKIIQCSNFELHICWTVVDRRHSPWTLRYPMMEI